MDDACILSNDKVLSFDNSSTCDRGREVAGQKADMLQGTLDLLILRSLMIGPLHGWGISKRIRDISRDALEVNQGSLYPALHRLEDRGFIEADWKMSDQDRRAKYYRLTKRGRKQFAEAKQRWDIFSSAVNHALQSGGGL
jgi:transcriptional regulator